MLVWLQMRLQDENRIKKEPKNQMLYKTSFINERL